MMDSSQERQRLDALREYRILDSEPEAVFDDLVNLLLNVCQAPIAIVSFMDADRQWFKATRGIEVAATSREIALCNHTVALQGYLVVPDTLEDKRFSSNPLVKGEPNIRFYAGVPIFTHDDYCVGTVAVMDSSPRANSPLIEETLQAASRLATRLMENRLQQLALKDSLTEQDRLVEKLEKHERRLDESRVLLEMAGQAARFGGWRADLEGGRVHWSREVAEIHEEPHVTSVSLERGIGYYIPEHRERIRKLFTRCVEQGATYDGEFQIITARGNRVWIRSLGMAVRDENGSVVAVKGAFQDISGLKEQEEKLRISEERYRHLADASQAAIWEYDMVTDSVTFTQSFKELMGVPENESLPADLDGYIAGIHPGDKDRVVESIRRLLDPETEDFLATEFRVKVWSGNYRWMQSNVKLIRDDQGNPIRRVGSTIDIHDRKVAEVQVQHLAERLTNTLASITDAVFAVDRNFNLTYLNPEAERLLGRERAEIVGKNLWEEFPGAREDLFGAEYVRAMSENKAVSFEAYFPPLEAWFSVRAFPAEDGLVVYFQDITEHKVSKRKLNEAVLRLGAILDAASDAIVTINEQGVIESVNPRAGEMFGHDTEALVGQKVNVLMPQEVADAHDNILERYLKIGESNFIGQRQRVDARHADGSIFPIEITVSEVTFSGRRVFTGFIRDVRPEEQARARLLESEERFRAVARATTDVVWDHDFSSNLVWWSAGMKTVFGYDVDDRTTHLDFWVQNLHPDDRERVVKGFGEAVSREFDVWKDEYRLRRSTGEYAIVSDHAVLIRNSGGVAVRMVGGIRDVTEHRRVEEQVAEQASLIDQAKDAIIVLGMDRKIRSWNKGAERIYGWKSREVVGQKASDLLYADSESIEESIRRVHDQGQWHGRAAQVTKTNTAITVESNWSLVPDSRGKEGAILVINTDITERLQLEEQLQHSRRLESIGQLTGGIAHDFNNLLTVILGNSELLSEQLADNENLKHLAEMTASAAQKGAELTSRLLAFARRQTLAPRATEIRKLVDDMKPLLVRSVPRNVDVRIIHGDNLSNAEIDAVQLETALLNLVINARDSMPDGGALTIETRNAQLDEHYAGLHVDLEPGNYVQLTVTDTGVGIPPEHMDRLFEPFFTTKEKGKGTGLGMPMVYGFVKQSRGHVSVYSEPGKGTTVCLYLPATGRDELKEVEPGRLADYVSASQKILVVEDQEMVREHAARLLRGMGFQVVEASDGSRALEIIREDKDFTLLFTDVVMPGGPEGPALADKVRQFIPGIRVLFTSGYTEHVISDRGWLEKGVVVLPKPYTRAELARKVREALQ